jgi:hypothetical protein
VFLDFDLGLFWLGIGGLVTPGNRGAKTSSPALHQNPFS